MRSRLLASIFGRPSPVAFPSLRLAYASLLLACCAPIFAQQQDPAPRFHFAPERNWMNDPNGLVFFDGEYHLFFQYNPYADRWGHMSWGHAVSRDLFHWQELPVAIPETDVMAFSGSVVVDWKNSSGLGRDGAPPLVAVYTGNDERRHHQSQYLAYSNDRGRHFTRIGKVLDPFSGNGFRDPKVFWHEPSKHWVMVAVLGPENRVVIFNSADLKHWQLVSHFGPAGARGRDWECPDLFELPVENGAPGESLWVLVVSVGEHAIGGGSGMQYFVGHFDGRVFSPLPAWGRETRWVDYGADFYAASSWNDLPQSDKRRIWIGWASNWRYANDIPTFPSRGLMSVPRQVGLRAVEGSYRLTQKPVAEIETLRGQATRSSGDLTPGTAVELPAIDSSEFILDLDTGSDSIANATTVITDTAATATATAEQITLTLTDPQGHQTLLGVNPAVNEVFLDRSRSGPHFFDGFEARHVAPVAMGSHHISLHVLVDHSIVELFINHGERVITDRFFPTGAPLRATLTSRGGAAHFEWSSWSMAR